MAVRVLEADASMRREYDRAVWDGPKPHFMQSWGWGEVKRETGWLPHRFLAVDEAGRARGALTVLARRVPGLGVVLYAPTGPAVDYRDEQAVAALLGAAERLARASGAILLRLDPDVPVDAPDVGSCLARLGFARGTAATAFEGLQPRFVMRLRLDPDPDAVLARFSPKTRYNVRHAFRQGVRVRSAERADLPAFYALLQATAARQRFRVRGLAYYESLWRHLIEPGQGRLFLAELDGRALAGVMVFRCGDTVWYLYGGTDYSARRLMPSHAAQWAAIQWACASGCRVYDFRGVSGRLDPSDPHYGLYRFKKGFGAELVEYPGEFDRVYRPARYHAFRLAFRALRAARRLLSRGVPAKEEDRGRD